MKAIKVQTREKEDGNYWCNSTVNGRDVSVTGDGPTDARQKFREETGLTNADIEWLPIEPYPHKEKIEMRPHLIRSQKVRLDHNPQG